jgi:lipopolysaccharide transport system permease protein
VGASIARVSGTKLEAPTRAASDAVTDSARSRGPLFVIRPAPRWPHLDIRELWHYRELLARLVWRDVSVRYKQTFLGVAWAVLVPAFTATIYIVVFGKFAKFPHGQTPYPSVVIAGVIPMQYFASALTGSSTSLVSNLPLVTKVYFPRVLLPLGTALVPLVDLLVGLPVLITLMAVYGTWPIWPAVLLAPAFIGLAFITALGIGFLLSAVNVRYRDVQYMIPVFLQVLPLVSGVMYVINEIPTKWQWLFAFNPMTAVISGWRWAVIGSTTPNWGQVAVGVAMGFVLFLLGLAVFRASEPRFADTI